MIINTNIPALHAWRQFSLNQADTTRSLERLSSGLRINRASDDAAGLAIANKMNVQIRGLEQANKNAQDGISLLQTAEGGLNEMHSILNRMEELATQASAAGLQTEDVDSMQTEFDKLVDKLESIADNTKFNGQNLLDGSLGATTALGTGLSSAAGIQAVTTYGAAADTYTLSYDADTDAFTLSDGTNSQTIGGVTAPAAGATATYDFTSLGIKVTVNENLTADIAANNTITVTGADAEILVGTSGEVVAFSIANMQTAALGVDSLDITTATDATAAITAITSALTDVSTELTNVGSVQTVLEHTISYNEVAVENLSAAESRIRDVDMAKEMSQFTKSNVLAQAASAMLAQANQQPQMVLQLLQG